MSLTSHLSNPQSLIYQFLHEGFPDAGVLAREVRARVASDSTLRPAVSTGFPWGLQGTAVSYRLGLYLGIPDWEELPAHKATRLIFDPHQIDPPLGALGKVFFPAIDALVRAVRPVGRRLDRPDEERVARACYGLALLDTIYRVGERELRRSPLRVPSPRTTAEGVLAIASDTVVDDLCGLSWAFYDTQADLWARGGMMCPTFRGSRDVGGADADLLVGDCLVEIKTLVPPFAGLSDGLYQLLGYVLLDYDDRLGLREVALYLARQARLVRWSLDMFLGTLARGRPVSPLPELRARFADLTRETRAARR